MNGLFANNYILYGYIGLIGLFILGAAVMLIIILIFRRGLFSKSLLKIEHAETKRMYNDLDKEKNENIKLKRENAELRGRMQSLKIKANEGISILHSAFYGPGTP